MRCTSYFSFTFDDGNISQICDYYPILRKYNFPATFYVTASEIGRPGKLTIDDLHSLVENGSEIGSHGWKHRPLMRLSPEELQIELLHSRDILKSFDAKSFAYPYGRYDRRIESEVERYYESARGHTGYVAANKRSSLSRYSILSFSVDGKYSGRINPHSPDYILHKRHLFQSANWSIVTLHGRTKLNPRGIKNLLKPERFTPEQVRGILFDIRARVKSTCDQPLRHFEALCVGLARQGTRVTTVSAGLQHFDQSSSSNRFS